MGSMHPMGTMWPEADASKGLELKAETDFSVGIGTAVAQARPNC